MIPAYRYAAQNSWVNAYDSVVDLPKALRSLVTRRASAPEDTTPMPDELIDRIARGITDPTDLARFAATSRAARDAARDLGRLDEPQVTTRLLKAKLHQQKPHRRPMSLAHIAMGANDREIFLTDRQVDTLVSHEFDPHDQSLDDGRYPAAFRLTLGRIPERVERRLVNVESWSAENATTSWHPPIEECGIYESLAQLRPGSRRALLDTIPRIRDRAARLEIARSALSPRNALSSSERAAIRDLILADLAREAVEPSPRFELGARFLTAFATCDDPDQVRLVDALFGASPSLRHIGMTPEMWKAGTDLAESAQHRLLETLDTEHPPLSSLSTAVSRLTEWSPAIASNLLDRCFAVAAIDEEHLQQICVALARALHHSSAEQASCILDFVERDAMSSAARVRFIIGADFDADSLTRPVSERLLALANSMHDEPLFEVWAKLHLISILPSETRDEAAESALEMIEACDTYSSPDVRLLQQIAGAAHLLPEPLQRRTLHATMRGSQTNRFDPSAEEALLRLGRRFDRLEESSSEALLAAALTLDAHHAPPILRAIASRVPTSSDAMQRMFFRSVVDRASDKLFGTIVATLAQHLPNDAIAQGRLVANIPAPRQTPWREALEYVARRACASPWVRGTAPAVVVHLATSVFDRREAIIAAFRPGIMSNATA